MVDLIYPVIMAGGSGTRLWPLSRQLNPKQFLPLVEEDLTMLQATIKRLDGLDVAAPLMVCNQEHRFLAAEQLRQIGMGDASILLEPAGRNTAPAIALAALEAQSWEEDPLLLIMAADHVINDVGAFQESVNNAVEAADSGKLVTFGVRPTHPETGYGYIEAGEMYGAAFRVKRFVEKPDVETARTYFQSGYHYWNSGMFMFRASKYLEALERYRNDILEPCKDALRGRARDLDFVRIDTTSFERCPSESIDYAVMEPLSGESAEAAMVPMDAGWSDIGSWSSLWEASSRDQQGNTTHGDVITHETGNSIVHGEHRLVTVLGLDNVAVIETKDAVLVADKDKVQEVKKIVERIRDDGRHEHLNHREVYRPWGVYDSVDNGDRYQVKRITVKPGERLSLQKHHHRAEHWVVVSGTAEVRNGQEEYIVAENESTFIPIGQVHSLRNPGVIPLELIEVQSGSYLGEDDIVRYNDDYGRIES